MNFWNFASWWIIKGLLGWAIFGLIIITGMLYYAFDDDRSAAMDKAIDRLREKENRYGVLGKVIDVITTILWPIGMIRYAVWMIHLSKDAERILSEKEIEG